MISTYLSTTQSNNPLSIIEHFLNDDCLFLQVSNCCGTAWVFWRWQSRPNTEVKFVAFAATSTETKTTTSTAKSTPTSKTASTSATLGGWAGWGRARCCPRTCRTPTSQSARSHGLQRSKATATATRSSRPCSRSASTSSTPSTTSTPASWTCASAQGSSAIAKSSRPTRESANAPVSSSRAGGQPRDAGTSHLSSMPNMTTAATSLRTTSWTTCCLCYPWQQQPLLQQPQLPLRRHLAVKSPQQQAVPLFCRGFCRPKPGTWDRLCPVAVRIPSSFAKWPKSGRKSGWNMSERGRGDCVSEGNGNVNKERSAGGKGSSVATRRSGSGRCGGKWRNPGKTPCSKWDRWLWRCVVTYQTIRRGWNGPPRSRPSRRFCPLLPMLSTWRLWPLPRPPPNILKNSSMLQGSQVLVMTSTCTSRRKGLQQQKKAKRQGLLCHSKSSALTRRRRRLRLKLQTKEVGSIGNGNDC